MFQSVDNLDQFNQSDSFKIRWRLHQFLSLSSNQSDKSESTVSLPLESTLLKIYSHTFISADKSIPCSSSLSQNMINDNDSQHSDTLTSMFFKAQMQILCSMIAQIKKEGCTEDCVNIVNSVSQQNSLWCSDVTDLSCHLEQPYSEWQDLSWHHQYDSDLNNFNNSDESVLNILNMFWRCHNNDNIQFHSEEVNFFNSHLDIKNYSINNIVDIDSKIYFQDVHLFIDSFKNIAHIKAEKVVHQNLNKCLQNIVQDWYIDQLSFIEREYIWKEQDMKHWKEMLFQQFKHTQSNMMKMLETEWYIIQNMQNNHELFRFVLNVIHHIKNTDMMETSAQLMWMWNHLNVSLHEDIHCFTDLIMMLLFIEDIKNIKEI